MSRRNTLRLLAAAGLQAALLPAARSQSDQLKIVCGFAAGGGTDVQCRHLATFLSGMGQNTIVDNRTGAGGQLAIQYVKDSAPDGRTMLITPMFTMGIYPHTYKRLPYDPVNDLVPVSLTSTSQYAIAVGPAVPASLTTVPELLRWFKANPSQASMGNPAAGSTPHFLGAMLGLKNDVKITHVPYRGGAPATMELSSGQIPSVFVILSELPPYAKTGKLRILGITGPARSKLAPEVKTMAEQGIEDMDAIEWFAAFVAKGTSRATVDKLNASIKAATAAPTYIAALGGIGYDAAASTPEALAGMLRTDIDRWGRAAKSIGFTAEN